jgi:hypothetical protein
VPKIRGFKPDLWTDEDFVELSPFARLLWMGMWNYACDNGHLADKSKQIKMRVLPTDDVNCAELLREIEAQGLIERADGWITIPNLTRHQKVDRRYFTSCEKPGCDDLPETVSQRAARRAPAGHTSSAQGAHAVSTPGALGDGEVNRSDGDGEGDSRAEGTTKPRKRATALSDDFQPNDANIQLAVSEGVDLRREFEKFCDYNRSKGSTYKDWHLALNNWIRKAAEYGGNVRPLRPQEDAQGRLILPPLPGNEWSGR